MPFLPKLRQYLDSFYMDRSLLYWQPILFELPQYTAVGIPSRYRGTLDTETGISSPPPILLLADILLKLFQSSRSPPMMRAFLVVDRYIPVEILLESVH